MTTEIKGSGKKLQGVVVKAAMQDTCTVEVSRYEKHAKYQKYMNLKKKFLVHDAGNTAKIGDRVTIQETRPISKRKYFTIIPA
jgi:small subunit ribosomal protein S17